MLKKCYISEMYVMIHKESLSEIILEVLLTLVLFLGFWYKKRAKV